MATSIYESGYINLIDGTELYITPLKIKYMRMFMNEFNNMRNVESEDERIDVLLECCRVAMQQYYPSIKTKDDVEDNIDMKTMYSLLKISGGVDLEAKDEEPKKQEPETKGTTWEEMDLAALEAEAFLIGIWKDYEELEASLSLPELTATLNSKREADYAEKKFLAAIQGVDLDKESGKEDPWEAMKARVFSRGQTSDANDVLALQGQNATRNGFGIGMGLDYERIE